MGPAYYPYRSATYVHHQFDWRGGGCLSVYFLAFLSLANHMPEHSS